MIQRLSGPGVEPQLLNLVSALKHLTTPFLYTFYMFYTAHPQPRKLLNQRRLVRMRGLGKCAEEALLRRADSAKPNPKGAQASANPSSKIYLCVLCVLCGYQPLHLCVKIITSPCPYPAVISREASGEMVMEPLCKPSEFLYRFYAETVPERACLTSCRR